MGYIQKLTRLEGIDGIESKWNKPEKKKKTKEGFFGARVWGTVRPDAGPATRPTTVTSSIKELDTTSAIASCAPRLCSSPAFSQSHYLLVADLSRGLAICRYVCWAGWFRLRPTRGISVPHSSGEIPWAGAHHAPSFYLSISLSLS
jgi:hypothetical protein